MSEQARAEWYPNGNGNERYWDGAAWTEHVRQPGGAEDEFAGAKAKLLGGL